eukprot:scaffold1485_cov171-Amphora_coffeaeformis.AAC.17
MPKFSEKKPPNSGDKKQSKLDSFFHCSPALTRISAKGKGSPKRSSPQSTASARSTKSVEKKTVRAAVFETNKSNVITKITSSPSRANLLAPSSSSSSSSTTASRSSLDKKEKEFTAPETSTSATTKSSSSSPQHKNHAPNNNTKSTKRQPPSRSPLRRLNNKDRSTKRPRDKTPTNNKEPNIKPEPEKAARTSQTSKERPLGLPRKSGSLIDANSSSPVISRILPKYPAAAAGQQAPDSSSPSTVSSQETSGKLVLPVPQLSPSKPLRPLEHVAVLRKPRKNERDKFGRLKIAKWEAGIVQKITPIKGKPFEERNKVAVLLESSATCTVEWTCDEKSPVQRWIPDSKDGSEHLEMLPSVKTTPAPQDLEIGDAVLAWFQCGQIEGCDPEYLFPGRVASIEGDRCSVAYDDGDWEDNIPYKRTDPKTVLIRFSKGFEEPQWMIGMRVAKPSKLFPRKKSGTVEKVESCRSVWLKYQGVDKPEKVAYRSVVQCIMSEARAMADRNRVRWPDTPASKNSQLTDLDSPSDTSEMGLNSSSKSPPLSALNNTIDLTSPDILNETFMSSETGVVSNDSSYRQSLSSAASEDIILETPPRKRPARRKRNARTTVKAQPREGSDVTNMKASVKESKTAMEPVGETIDLADNSSDSEIEESPAKKQKRSNKLATKKTTTKRQNQAKSKLAPSETSDTGAHEIMSGVEKKCVPEDEIEDAFKWRWPTSHSAEPSSPVPTGLKPSSRLTAFSIPLSSSIQRAWKSTDTQLAADYLSHTQSHHGLKPNDNLKSFMDELLLKGPQSGASSRIAYPDCQKMDLASEVTQTVDISWNDFWEQMSSDLYTVVGDDRRMNQYAVQRIAASAHAKSVTAKVFLRQCKEDYPCTPLTWLEDIRNSKGPREAFQSALNTVVSLWKSYSHFYFATHWDIAEVSPDSRVFVQRNTRQLMKDLGQVLSFAGQVYSMDENSGAVDLAYFISSRVETSLHSFTLPKELRGELAAGEYKRKMMMQIILDLDQKVIPCVRPLIASQLGLESEYNFLFSLD